jgi:hypothetical protein
METCKNDCCHTLIGGCLKEEAANKLKEAAKAWEFMSLPEFSVHGYLDGINEKWTVPEVLKVAAEQILKRALGPDE